MKKKGKSAGFLQSVGEYALSIGVFIAVWWLYVELKHVPAYILPAPPKVFKSLVEMFVKRSVYAHLWTTSYEAGLFDRRLLRRTIWICVCQDGCA